MFAIAAGVRPVFDASSVRVTGPLTRNGVQRDPLVVVPGARQVGAGQLRPGGFGRLHWTLDWDLLSHGRGRVVGVA